MDPTDIADITGHDFTFLMNGLAPESNWTGIFRPGERVRLRFINSAAVTFFDVRNSRPADDRRRGGWPICEAGDGG